MKIQKIFWLSFVLFTLIIGIQIFLCLDRNGMFVYPLDDSYIHMAIAKNIAHYGVWGVTRYGFSSASSSILYTLILSLFFRLFGVSIWIPLIINWLTAAAMIYFVVRWTSKYLSTRATFLFTIAFIFIVPLPTITIIGMEHTLHILLSLLFIRLSFKYFLGSIVGIGYFLVALLMVATRYEGIFLVCAAAMVWVFLKQRVIIGIGLLLAMLLPIVIFGTYSVIHGGYFLPNTLLVKGAGDTHSAVQFVGEKLQKFFDSGMIYALLFFPVTYFFCFPIRKPDSIHRRPVHLLLLMIGVSCLLHFIFARFGRPFRYGGYLIAMELMIVPLALNRLVPNYRIIASSSKLILIFLSCIFLLPIFSRVGVAFITNRCINNIHDQQIEMAFFVKRYFPKATIALNDIGAVAFYNDSVKIFDIVGLSNTDVLAFHDKSDTSFLEKYTQRADVQMALIYPTWIEWLGYRKPSQWKLLGTWTLTNNYIAGNPQVGIFACQPEVADTLLSALKSYSQYLPVTVHQHGMYMRPNK